MNNTFETIGKSIEKLSQQLEVVEQSKLRIAELENLLEKTKDEAVHLQATVKSLQEKLHFLSRREKELLNRNGGNIDTTATMGLLTHRVHVAEINQAAQDATIARQLKYIRKLEQKMSDLTIKVSSSESVNASASANKRYKRTEL